MWVPLHRSISSPQKRKRRIDTSPGAGMGPGFRSSPLTGPLHHVDVPVSAVGAGAHAGRSSMVGHSSIQGWRASMEDKYIIDDLTSIPKHSLVAVFDGHAGSECAAFCSNNLVDLLQATPSWKLYRALYNSHDLVNGGIKNKHKRPESELKEERNKLLSQALVEAYIQLDFEFLKSLLPPECAGDPSITNIDELGQVIDKCILAHIQEEMVGGGCTAVCSIITPDSVIVANCGDSRCVISGTAPVDPQSSTPPVSAATTSSGPKKHKKHKQPPVISSASSPSYTYTSIAMTEDHKPSNPDEKERVLFAGGLVHLDRVDGSLAMSRAIGDFRYKLDPMFNLMQQKVIAIPDISIYDRQQQQSHTGDAMIDHDLMILACDGVFDVMDNVDVVKNVRDIVQSIELMSEQADVISGDDNNSNGNEGLVRYSDVARILISNCLALESTDNISVCIVPLNRCK